MRNLIFQLVIITETEIFYRILIMRTFMLNNFHSLKMPFKNLRHLLNTHIDAIGEMVKARALTI